MKQNSKLDRNLEDFIRLRIEGKSFNEISQELKISRQTLIERNKKKIVREAIDEGEAFKINELVRAFKFDSRTRLTTYLTLSKKINDELLRRDLSEVSSDILLKMAIEHDARTKDLIGGYRKIGNDPDVADIEGKDGFFHFSPDE